MRYFAELSYKGTNYSGWQRQPNAMSVQQKIEEALSMILRVKTEVVCCGRTDAGVHASQFFLHFDFEGALPDNILKRINKYLPGDIAISRIFEVDEKAHTRFDASFRAYEYHVVFDKNPFKKDSAFFYPFGRKLDISLMQEAASILLKYDSFFPFCKTNSDAKTMFCTIERSEWVWEKEGEHLVFHIAANRFLRGMVRLVVGMCLNVGLGKVKIAELYEAMDKQERLKQSYSVPPNGLFLCEIRYPYINQENE